MSSGFVLLSRFPSFQPARFLLPEGLTIVGRSSACDFVIPNDTVSRQHAEIQIAGQKATVRDLGSSNGTFLSGKQVRKSALKFGQEIRFGQVVFLISSADADDAELDSDEETHRLTDGVPKGSRTILLDSYLLTPAQRRVLDMLLDGLREKEVARILHIGQETVHTHIKEIYRVCGVHSRAELLALFVKRDGNDQ
jgi:pSer/pThr/pTyr-binding forkhead associated (FHA) protein